MGRRSLEFDQNSSTGTQDRQGLTTPPTLLAIAYRWSPDMSGIGRYCCKSILSILARTLACGLARRGALRVVRSDAEWTRSLSRLDAPGSHRLRGWVPL